LLNYNINRTALTSNKHKIKSTQFKNHLDLLKDCCLCPRNCHINRLSGGLGYCRSDSQFNIGAICLHHGEEPPISGKNGICNVFFGHCNMQCMFCQNFQISNLGTSTNARFNNVATIIDTICDLLDKNVKSIGFVSATHCIPHMKVLITMLKGNGYSPVIVYNTNAYEKPETLKCLENYVDVYLPDYKYMYENLAKKYSDAPGYPEIALNAIKEMYRQKGSDLVIDDDGIATNGIIIRHLVLPGQIQNSLAALEAIATSFSTKIHISLMSQYYPTKNVSTHPNLNRTLSSDEYQIITDKMEELGFEKGWIQEPDSENCYRPDFDRSDPFNI